MILMSSNYSTGLNSRLCPQQHRRKLKTGERKGMLFMSLSISQHVWFISRALTFIHTLNSCRICDMLRKLIAGGSRNQKLYNYFQNANSSKNETGMLPAISREDPKDTKKFKRHFETSNILFWNNKVHQISLGSNYSQLGKPHQVYYICSAGKDDERNTSSKVQQFDLTHICVEYGSFLHGRVCHNHTSLAYLVADI